MKAHVTVDLNKLVVFGLLAIIFSSAGTTAQPVGGGDKCSNKACVVTSLTSSGAISGTTAAFSGTVTSSVASGSNGIAFSTNGARLDLGTASGDFLSVKDGMVSAGDGLTNMLASSFVVNGASGTGMSKAADHSLSITVNRVASTTGWSAPFVSMRGNSVMTGTDAVLFEIRNGLTDPVFGVDKNGAALLNVLAAEDAALDTCNAANRGKLWFQKRTGAGAGTGDRLVLCNKEQDGVYRWSEVFAT